MKIVSMSLVALALSISVVAFAPPSQARAHKTPEWDSTNNMSSARAAAVHECSLQADKAYPAAGYGSANAAKYRACLTEHGQKE
jgi:hypothetical protein